MNRDRHMQMELQKMYGDAPETFRAELRRTCRNMKEGAPVKKISGAVLVFGLMLLLVGVAFAARQLGAFAFLFPDQLPPQGLEERRQTQLFQEGGEMEAVEIRVLDAVTDGLSGFMAVEVKAKSPEDVLFSEYDTKGLQETPVDSRRRLIFWQPDEMGENLYLRGREWKRLDDQTLLLHYIIDLQGQDFGEDQSLQFSPGIRVQKSLLEEAGLEEELERTQVAVRLHSDSMERQVRVVETSFEVPALDIKVEKVEITFTPLATYLHLEYSALQLSPEEWQERYSNLWFHLEDGTGNPVEALTGGRKRGDDAAEIYQEVQERMYRQAEPSADKLVLVPYISHTMETFETVELPLS